MPSAARSAIRFEQQDLISASVPAARFDLVRCRNVAIFLVVAVLMGIALTIAALALEEFNFRRHRRGRDILRMLAYAVAENVGFRQLNDFWRLLALVDLARRTQGWGAQQRRGIGRATAAAPDGRQPRGS